MVKATLKIYPAISKVNAISGRMPFYLRLTEAGRKAEARLPIQISSEDVIYWNNSAGRLGIKNSEINNYINSIEAAFMQFKIEHATNSKTFDVREIRDELLGLKKNKRITIYDFAFSYYSINIDKNSNFSDGTKKYYKKSLNHLRRYVKIHKMENTTIQNLDFNFASSFAAYLMADDEKNGRIGMSEASACGIIKKFRKIFNDAVQKELINKNPFLSIKLSYRSPVKTKLSISQFQKIIDSSQLDRFEKKVAGVFAFMSLTGCAFKDCMGLDKNNLMDTEYGTKLYYVRIKSGIESSQFLTQKALKLLIEFSEIESVKIEGGLVPKISNQQMNRTLKLIASKFEIHFNLCSHDARHTFRQLLDEADISDPAVICKLMGWSNNDKMESIYRKITDTRLVKTKEQFDEFIQKLTSKF